MSEFSGALYTIKHENKPYFSFKLGVFYAEGLRHHHRRKNCT